MFRTYQKTIAAQICLAFVTAVSLFVIIWSAWQVIIQPDLGALWADNGVVYYAHQNSDLLVDDQVLRIDGVLLADSSFPYYQWQHGDILQLEVERAGERLIIETLYTEPAPPFILIVRLSLNFVALAFWLVGLAVILLSPTFTKQNILFFLWCQALGASLALGAVTSQAWAGHFSHIATWWAIGLAIHFHLIFPVAQTLWQTSKPIIGVYGITLLGVTLRLVLALESTPSGILATTYALTLNLWLLVGLILVLWLLVRAYRNSYSPVTKRQVGMVALCGFVAGVPLLTLSIFPAILFGEALLPIPFSLLFLIVLPLGYGYAIRRYQFIRLERYISRSATAVYVIGTLCVLYFAISYLLQSLSDDNVLTNPLVNLLMVMTLVVVYNPLYRRLQNLVDYLMYGGWYDYPTVVSQVTHTLESTTGIETIAQTLTMSVQKTMRVNWVYLLWQEDIDTPTSIYASENTENPLLLDTLYSDGLPSIIRFLKQQTQPVNNQQIRHKAADWDLTDEEAQLIESDSVRLWIPIQGLKQSLGLLLLGPKYGGDLFNAEDLEILDVVSRQASVIFQNAQLIGELEEKVNENEQYQKEIFRTREEERKRIARELHDQIIQQLVGLKYHTAQIEATAVHYQTASTDNGQQRLDLESEIGALIETTRHLCQDLRPAALDLGLIPAIRSLVNRFEMDHSIGVNLNIEGDRKLPIDEDTALCLFRCTGEALSNIRKHASATQIDIDLTIQPERVRLTIGDNGTGFEVPQRLGRLMNNDHFGLVGMRERVELLQGTFDIVSAPALGTRLEVSIPV